MALRATLEGHEVMKMDDAAKYGEIFHHCHRNERCDRKKTFRNHERWSSCLQHGALRLRNQHSRFKKLTEKVKQVRDNNEEFTLKNGKRIYVLGQGRLINLLQRQKVILRKSWTCRLRISFCAATFLYKQNQTWEKVYVLPKEQDQEIARIKMETMGLGLDKLTDDQVKYLTDYSSGT